MPCEVVNKRISLARSEILTYAIAPMSGAFDT